MALWRECESALPRTDEMVARTLRKHPYLNDGQRDQIISIFQGMIVHTRKIEFALDHIRLAHNMVRHRRTLAFSTYRLLNRWCKVSDVAGELPGTTWFDVNAVLAAIDTEADPARRLGLSRGLPDFLAARLLAVYGDQADAIALALGERAPQTMRANTLKIQRDALQKQLVEKGIETVVTPHAPTGLTLVRRTNPFKLREFQDGLFEMQDESSQLAVEIVAPPPGSLVIDFCAGAGGKTLALGALMNNKGRLIALDTLPRKITELRKRAARAGLSNLQAIAIGEHTLPPEVEALKGKAARVLVDVPCTGSGALRRNPEGRWRLQPEDLTRLPMLQEAIARRAMEFVAPGGRLVYATCSILPEENEAVVAKLLQPTVAGEGAPAAPAATWQPVLVKEVLGKARAQAICDPTGQVLKLLPTAGGHDGFFTAVLRRTT